MIKFRWIRDPEFQVFAAYRGVVSRDGWLDVGYILSLYWFRIEIAKFWES